MSKLLIPLLILFVSATLYAAEEAQKIDETQKPENFEELDLDSPISEMIRALSYKKDPRIRRRASIFLRFKKVKEAIPAMGLAMLDEDVRVRWNVSGALKDFGDERVFNVLARALEKDEDAEVRKNAARAIAKIGGEKALKVLHDRIVEDDDGVRYYIAKAIRESNRKCAFWPLMKLANDGNVAIQRHAILGLGELQNRYALPIIKMKIGTSESWVAAISKQAFEKIYRANLEGLGNPAPEKRIPTTSPEPTGDRATKRNEENISNVVFLDQPTVKCVDFLSPDLKTRKVYFPLIGLDLKVIPSP